MKLLLSILVSVAILAWIGREEVRVVASAVVAVRHQLPAVMAEAQQRIGR